MEKYESKQQKINRPAEAVYATLSDFSHFTPILKEKAEEWQADSDTCSFVVKGLRIRLRMVEREAPKLIKVVGENSPVEFTFWTQLKQVADNDTRMRLVLHVELNMMLRMMVGNKLQKAMDEVASQIAYAFNNAPI